MKIFSALFAQKIPSLLIISKEGTYHDERVQKILLILVVI